jgi:adenylyltransferase/sulfurtransferase
MYLAAAGIGTLTLVDSDHVSVTNLHRQILYGAGDVGHPKVQAAATALGRAGSDTHIIAWRHRWDATDDLSGYDVVVDCTDTWTSRLAVAQAAEHATIPVVWGAVSGWFGQVTVFHGEHVLSAVFPEPPAADFGVCDAGGVLGTLCGQVGTAMATEVIKVVTGVGTTLAGTMSVIDAREGTWRTLPVARHDR